MGIFGLGTHKVQNFGFFWVLPLGSREDWVPKIWVPKGNTRTRIKIWVWVGLGLCPNSMGIFGLGTHKFQNFGFFRVLPLGTQEYWVPKIRAPKGNTRTIL